MNSPALAYSNQTESFVVQQIYHDHHSWLQAWLRRRLGCSQQAADLAQDTFLRLISQHQAMRIREPRAWLTTVAHGLVVNHWRRKDIENAYLQVLAEQERCDTPSPEQQAIVVDALIEIDSMLATLPAKARQAFLWVHLDGLTYKQVAERLAVSERMVKKYMAQAMLNCLLCQDS
ncbi:MULTISPECIES: sigma-70 family RNA polymerase sigma factor [unclassified Brenneria]|uniref:sigma-70 family RNA polymerase sigma factor n=1 Tax=Brenneria sp. L3-3C-1 TaxID=2799634 RepID=UPI0018F0F3EE|nr:sigma-70 family RNA polymerase sigma factor [Brenneria sp. L3-3C-1]MEE3643944.1 sigma-70 family RNA polymerase sigma factor [Brenneria sp. L3_3C_1]